MATQTNTFDQRGLLLLDYVTPGTTGKSHELFKQLTRAPLIRTADDPTLFKMFPGNCWASHAGRRLLSVSSIPVAFEEPSLVAWQDTLSAAQQATPLHVSTGQESSAPSNVRESKLAKTTGATSMRQQHRRQAQDAEEETASSSSSSSPAPSSAAAVAAHRMPTFVPGDLVWVQERGYPYWPALVALVARAGGRLKVEFFGEETNADVSLSRVLPFRNAQFGKLCSGKDVAPLQQTAFRSGLRDAVQYEKEQQVNY